MADEISFRPITKMDQPFLYRLYASTRTEEVAQTGWSEFEKENFLRQQFTAQHQFYTEQFSHAEFMIVLANNIPVGRVYVDHRKDEIRLIDIALLPETRGKGIGTRILRNLLSEAGAQDKMVRIHVERFNPALRLYERLGFKKIGDTGVYFLMEWQNKTEKSLHNESV